jgi:hypothetical protein
MIAPWPSKNVMGALMLAWLSGCSVSRSRGLADEPLDSALPDLAARHDLAHGEPALPDLGELRDLAELPDLASEDGGVCVQLLELCVNPFSNGPHCCTPLVCYAASCIVTDGGVWCEEQCLRLAGAVCADGSECISGVCAAGVCR